MDLGQWSRLLATCLECEILDFSYHTSVHQGDPGESRGIVLKGTLQCRESYRLLLTVYPKYSIREKSDRIIGCVGCLSDAPPADTDFSQVIYQKPLREDSAHRQSALSVAAFHV